MLARRTLLTDKIVLVTGASSGIGAAVALECAKRGANLVLLARRVDRLEAVAAQIRAMGRDAMSVRCDVTKERDVVRAAAAARRRFGRIDVVVANAGFQVAGRFEELTLADFHRQFDTNVFGVLRTIYATLDDLRRSRGTLVVIGSVTGHVSVPGGSAYAMSKFAVRALTEALRQDLAPEGVAVVLISPGFV